MATLSANLELVDLGTGESAYDTYANWGEAADANFGFLEDAVSEVTEVALTAVDVTLTMAQARSLVIKCTGVLAANVSVETPNKKGFWIVSNETTGDFTLTFKTDSGTGHVIAQGGKAILYSDGTNQVRVVAVGSNGSASRIVRSAKSGAFTAGQADDGTFFDVTSTATMSLKPAALLGDKWSCWVTARTGVTLTIDPNGAETVNGGSTLILGAGYSALIVCTGSAFNAIIVASSGEVTLAGSEALSNKTISSSTIVQPVLTLEQGSSVAPTAEGRIAWDTDDNQLKVGDGAATVTMASLTQENQPLTGGASVTSKSLGTQSTGTLTLDMGDRPMQHYTNNGAHTLAPGSEVGSILLDIVNGAAAGAITTSGFTKVVGDTFTTTNGHKFRCGVSVGQGGSLLTVQALQ